MIDRMTEEKITRETRANKRMMKATSEIIAERESDHSPVVQKVERSTGGAMHNDDCDILDMLIIIRISVLGDFAGLDVQCGIGVVVQSLDGLRWKTSATQGLPMIEMDQSFDETNFEVKTNYGNVEQMIPGQTSDGVLDVNLISDPKFKVNEEINVMDIMVMTALDYVTGDADAVCCALLCDVADFMLSAIVDHRTISSNNNTAKYHKVSGVTRVSSNFKTIFQTVIVYFFSPRIVLKK